MYDYWFNERIQTRGGSTSDSVEEMKDPLLLCHTDILKGIFTTWPLDL